MPEITPKRVLPCSPPIEMTMSYLNSVEELRGQRIERSSISYSSSRGGPTAVFARALTWSLIVDEFDLNARPSSKRKLKIYRRMFIWQSSLDGQVFAWPALRQERTILQFQGLSTLDLILCSKARGAEL